MYVDLLKVLPSKMHSSDFFVIKTSYFFSPSPRFRKLPKTSRCSFFDCSYICCTVGLLILKLVVCFIP